MPYACIATPLDRNFSIIGSVAQSQKSAAKHTIGLLRTVKAGSDGVYTTNMAKHACTKVKTEEKYKVTATLTHIYKFA